jgi:glycosyltransferase involved in cell wall biosynthesis
VVHTFHGHLIYGYFAKYKTFLFTLLERVLSKFTNAAASITNETQSSLQKLGIGKRLKWQVIQLGIPLTNIGLHDPSSDETIKLLWVGRFTDIKDSLYAVNVLKELNKSHPNKFKLTMVGGGELLDEAKSYAGNLPVTFTGWLDKPFESAGYFDLLLLTSKNEGMGLVILEAANCNKATVSRDVGGVGEFIKDGVNGLLINGSADLMSSTIAKLSKTEISNLGKAAHQTLVKSFTDKVMADNYYKLYKSLI